jgi:inositol transport system substrate-binding protein
MAKQTKACEPDAQNAKTISVLFSTYTDFISRLIGLRSGFKCTHVSISLDENDEYFYAFNTKGFRKEYPKKHKRRTKENMCLRLQVTENQYKTICNRIKKFERKQKKYSYDYLGIILCLFRLHRQKKQKYFCSSFVAELLEKAKVVQLKKTSQRYLPYQLQKELLLCPLLIGIAQNIFL